jgi:hypothetical protein
MADIFIFNGEIKRGSDLRFIELVYTEKKDEECLLVLVTPGGSPDAAYKIARYLQSKYEKFSVIVSGLCKSAGTLLSVGADELIFMPYGELGPLDVQMAKTDNLAGLESGLNISEAFMALEGRARDTYSGLILEIIQSSGGVVSFQSAAHAASEVVSSMYGPIFARIDPEEVGSRSRAMRIGEDYCKRLNAKWSNLKPDALSTLSQTYSSHGFVIDFLEAKSLFNRVREPTEEERKFITQLGALARHPHQGQLTIRKIGNIQASSILESSSNDEGSTSSRPRSKKQKRGSILNGQHPEKSGKIERPSPESAE